MQTLAACVGDWKRVLTHVKTRGTLGEAQRGALLEDMLAPVQYARNVAVVPTRSARVDFAVRSPGNLVNADGSGTQPLWLPIDAKFPREDYARLIDAQERADQAALDL